jgi:hypothetical protein
MWEVFPPSSFRRVELAIGENIGKTGKEGKEPDRCGTLKIVGGTQRMDSNKTEPVVKETAIDDGDSVTTLIEREYW